MQLRTKVGCAGVVAALVLLHLPWSAGAARCDSNLLIVLDRSCSMQKVPAGETRSKWKIAVEAIDKLLADFRGKLRFGLALFPDTTGDRCAQDAIPIPVGPANEDAVSQLLAETTITGPCVTNIDTAIKQAAGDPGFKDSERRSFVLLITDGAQSKSCGGVERDAVTVQAIKQLLDAFVPTYVIGFGGAVRPASLDAFAQAGGVPRPGGNPSYYQADSAAQLDAILNGIGQQLGSDEFTGCTGLPCPDGRCPLPGATCTSAGICAGPAADGGGVPVEDGGSGATDGSSTNGGSGAIAGDGGCACSTASASAPPPPALLLLGVLGLGGLVRRAAPRRVLVYVLRRGPGLLVAVVLGTPPLLGACAESPRGAPGDALVGDQSRPGADAAARDGPGADLGQPDLQPDAGADGCAAAVCGDQQCGCGEDAQSCPADCKCVQAKRLWFDDFETGDYSRWTSNAYGNDWNGGLCHANGFSTAQANSPTRSHRSEITCAIDQSHRGYGGLQFAGDSVVPAYTNTGSGIDAPHGVVNTYWSWLEVPYAFGNGRWFSFWTVNNSCDWSDRVITLGLEDSSNRLTPAHIKNSGGTVTFTPGAAAFPLGQWVRTTIYINYHAGAMHVWQNGQHLLHATFSRPTKQICQWHWGAYASKDNTDVVLFEDDNSIWKLEEPWTDFAIEPWFEGPQQACSP